MVFRVTKHGAKKTTKDFNSYYEAERYYDRVCKNNPEDYTVHMEEVIDGGNMYVMIFRNHKDYQNDYVKRGQYRNAKDSVKKKDKGMHPFGL